MATLATDLPAVLRGAQDVVLERGHTQGRFYDDDGRVCLVSAVLAAQGVRIPGDELLYDAIAVPALDAVHDACRAMGFADVGEACVWNNALGRTTAEVVARLERGVDALAVADRGSI